MQNLRRRFGKRLPQLSADGLKLIAAVLLLSAYAGRILIEHGLIHLENYTQDELLTAMDTVPGLTGRVGWASILRLLAGPAVPIFAFLTVEGFLHTGRFGRYLLRVALLAVVSEIPYDWAITGRAFDFSAQNPVWGVAICLAMLYCMSRLDKMPAVERVIGSLLIFLCAAFWSVAARAEYGLQMAALCGIFYCLREREVAKMLLALLVSLASPLGPMGLIAVFLYGGQQKRKRLQYVWYALFPAAVTALGLIACFL